MPTQPDKNVPQRKRKLTTETIKIDPARGVVYGDNGKLGRVSEIIVSAPARQGTFGNSLQAGNGIVEMNSTVSKKYVAKKYPDRDMILIATKEDPPALYMFSR